jgi:multidrug efflux pump subunit AcrA (membrane-fusion protein)
LIARNSNAIDPLSRTLKVEVDIDNPRTLLLPGAYVFVHLPLPADFQSLTIPSNALLFRREGLRVGVIRDGRVQLVPISMRLPSWSVCRRRSSLWLRRRSISIRQIFRTFRVLYLRSSWKEDPTSP